ncbi:MAG: homocysteine S-methyltransferase [Longimicrobiales bacterium]
MESLSRNPFGPLLDAHGLVVLDGGLATALEGEGHALTDELWSARLLRDDPGAITSIHRRYLEAGADCLTTASYQASYAGFAAAGIGRSEAAKLLLRSTRLARGAIESHQREGPGALVAASIGPYAAYLADGSEYTGRYDATRSEIEAFHGERWDVLASSAPDVMACETIPNGVEAEALLEVLAGERRFWAWFSFCCGDEGHLWDGTPIERVVEACDAAERVAAVGVNCTAPHLVPSLVARIRAVTDLPILVYPNSGERYVASSRTWRGTDEPWMTAIERSIRAGATIVGGCCRIGPDRIAELRARVDRGDWST